MQILGKSQNLFDLRFRKNPAIKWSVDDEEIVELVVPHEGFFAGIATHIFRRPKESKIKLDALGSFVWRELEEKDDIFAISETVKERFGDEAEPLLPRLAEFFKILEANELIVRKK